MVLHIHTACTHFHPIWSPCYNSGLEGGEEGNSYSWCHAFSAFLHSGQNHWCRGIDISIPIKAAVSGYSNGTSRVYMLHSHFAEFWFHVSNHLFFRNVTRFVPWSHPLPLEVMLQTKHILQVYGQLYCPCSDKWIGSTTELFLLLRLRHRIHSAKMHVVTTHRYFPSPRNS